MTKRSKLTVQCGKTGEVHEAVSTLIDVVTSDSEPPHHDGWVQLRIVTATNQNQPKPKFITVDLPGDVLDKLMKAKLMLQREKRAAATNRVCNRDVCSRKTAKFYNASTEGYYCYQCAREINKYNPGLCSTVIRTFLEWEAVTDERTLARGAP